MADRSDGTAEIRSLALAKELRALIGKLKRRLREQASIGDLTPSQASVLFRLRETSATISELAALEGVRPQSMGATVAALEGAGLIRGAAHPSDGRKVVWSLTSVFRKRVETGHAAQADWLFRTISRELSAAEQEQLDAGLRLIRRLVDT
ncbi:MAG: MarR family transcriptional regulator [Proteobacteria bacterium]|nr:MarR family transcriptional regulator [Pseudomonadota bacterium]